MDNELVNDMNIVSENIFEKTKSNAMTSKPFSAFINKHKIDKFYVAGTDAMFCVKATCCSMVKQGYRVSVLSDCITSRNKSKIDKMLTYYAGKGCRITTLACESN